MFLEKNNFYNLARKTTEKICSRKNTGSSFLVVVVVYCDTILYFLHSLEGVTKGGRGEGVYCPAHLKKSNSPSPMKCDVLARLSIDCTLSGKQ